MNAIKIAIERYVFCIFRLCPDGKAFDNGTATCHKLLEKGPCGDLQLFYSISKDSDYGACACMSNEDGCNQLVKSNRMILPSSDGKKCFWAYSSVWIFLRIIP